LRKPNADKRDVFFHWQLVFAFVIKLEGMLCVVAL